MSARTRQLYEGCIAGAAFGNGEAVIVGMWRKSPHGRFVDVFWVRPGGERILLAPRPEIRAAVSAIYTFDRTEVAPLHGGWDGTSIDVVAGPLRLLLQPGPRDWRSMLFALRPRPLRRAPAWITLEDRLARPAVGRLIGGAGGVRATGIAPGGQREWYGVDDWRPITQGFLQIDGHDAGPLRTLPADLGVGLSGFPRTPALVFVATIIESPEQPSGRW